MSKCGMGLPCGATLPAGGSFTAPARRSVSPPPTRVSRRRTCIGFPTTCTKTPPTRRTTRSVCGSPTPPPCTSPTKAGTNTYSSTANQYTAAAASTTAGLQKWVFDSATNQWDLAYTLQAGLNLGVPYTPSGYPTGTNTYGNSKGTTLSGPWAPATDGLRNLTGQVNPDGTVTICAATSTVSRSGDQGADPNELVSITDHLSATSLPSGENFQTLMAPTNKQVIRGVSFVPATGPANALPEVPWQPVIPIAGAAVGGLVYAWHRRLRLDSSI